MGSWKTFKVGVKSHTDQHKSKESNFEKILQLKLVCTKKAIIKAFCELNEQFINIFVKCCEDPLKWAIGRYWNFKDIQAFGNAKKSY